MKDVPKALWAFVVLSLVPTAIYLFQGAPEGDLEIGVSWRVGWAVGGMVLLALLALLLRRSRVVWSLLAVFGVLGLVSAALTGESWAILFRVAFLACLLAPSSRRFVWRKGPESATAAPPGS